MRNALLALLLLSIAAPAYAQMVPHPVEPVPGPKGEKGDKGDQGLPGKNSTVPGPPGTPYGPVSWGTVTQLTNKDTPVTLNTMGGQIIMGPGNINGNGTRTFVLNDSYIAKDDVVDVVLAAGTIRRYWIDVDQIIDGQATISIRNYSSGPLDEPLALNFRIHKVTGSTGSVATSAIPVQTKLVDSLPPGSTGGHTMAGVGISITPANSGNVVFTFSGDLNFHNTGPGFGIWYYVVWGTGAPPAAGSAMPNVFPCGAEHNPTIDPAVLEAVTRTDAFTLQCLVKGQVGTQYWADIAERGIGAVGSVNFKDIDATAIELAP